MPTEKNALSIGLYLGLTLVLSSVFWSLIIFLHPADGGGRYVQALMWCPAAAAFLTVLLRKLDFGGLGLGWGPTGRYALIGYLTPIAYAAIAYTLIWVSGLGSFPSVEGVAALAKRLGWGIANPVIFVPLYTVFIGLVGMVPSLASALGEEIGWRGFLAPRMTRSLGFTTGAMVVGVIWTAWHLPLLLFAGYNNGAPWWVGLPCFGVMVVSLSVMLAWIRLKSNSVWPCAIFHASHNLFIQAVFTPLTGARPDGLTKYAVDEFGLVVPLVTVVFAIGFWLRRTTAEAAVQGPDAVAA